jgi:hypothetical protein
METFNKEWGGDVIVIAKTVENAKIGTKSNYTDRMPWIKPWSSAIT